MRERPAGILNQRQLHGKAQPIVVTAPHQNAVPLRLGKRKILLSALFAGFRNSLEASPLFFRQYFLGIHQNPTLLSAVNLILLQPCIRADQSVRFAAYVDACPDITTIAVRIKISLTIDTTPAFHLLMHI